VTVSSRAQLTISSYMLGKYPEVDDEGIGLAYIAPQPPEAFEQPLGTLRRRLGSVKKGPKSIFFAENPISANSTSR
jgi:hypothetical protein